MPVKLSSTGGGDVTLAAPNTGSSYTITLPAATANLVTTSDSGVVTTGMIASNAITRSLLPTGSVLQVVQTAKTSTTSIAVSGNSWNEFDSAFRVSITPISTNNKILLTACVTGAQNTGTVRYKFQYSTNGGSSWSDVTPIGDASSNRSRGHFGYAVNGDTNQFNTCTMEILHSPGVNTNIIYRIQFGQDVSTTYYFNRSIAYGDNFLGGTMTSTFIAKEIVG